MSKRWNRALAALVLFAALGTAPAAAWNRGRVRDEARITAPARAWILELVGGAWSRLVGVWENAGVVADPNG